MTGKRSGLIEKMKPNRSHDLRTEITLSHVRMSKVEVAFMYRAIGMC